MNKIPCEVIMDLIPLVEDHVASAESEQLVKEHIAHCAHCKELWHPQPTPWIDDHVLIQKIRQKRNLYLSFILLIGLIMGSLLSSGYYLFYNLLILPILGILCHLIKPSKTYSLILMISSLFTLITALGYLLQFHSLEGFLFDAILSVLTTTFLLFTGKTLAMLNLYAWKGRWK